MGRVARRCRKARLLWRILASSKVISRVPGIVHWLIGSTGERLPDFAVDGEDFINAFMES